MKPIIDTPNMESTNKKPVVIGNFSASLVFGNEFHISDVRFFDGNEFRPLLNALVYTGNKISIGGWEFIREKGKEFWIVQFGTEEFVFDRLVHNATPNVELIRRPTPTKEAKK